MRLSTFAARSPIYYANKRPVYIEGGVGIAKSATIETLPHLLAASTDTHIDDWGLITRHLSLMPDGELDGYLVPTKDADGVNTTVRTEPELIRAIRATGCPFGVVFLDELPQSSVDNQKAACTLLNDRRIGDHSLPDGWWVVAAGNRQKDRAGAGRLLSILTNRVKRLEVTMPVVDWLEWANAQDFNQLALGYAEFAAGEFSGDVPKQDGPFLTFRSFTAALQEITHETGTDFACDMSSELRESIAGDIGEGHATGLKAFIDTWSTLPKIAELIADPAGAAIPTNAAAQYAAVRLCVHHADSSNVEPLMTYIGRLNKEYQTSAVSAILAKKEVGGSLLNSPSLIRWMSENRALVAATIA